MVMVCCEGGLGGSEVRNEGGAEMDYAHAPKSGTSAEKTFQKSAVIFVDFVIFVVKM